MVIQVGCKHYGPLMSSFSPPVRVLLDVVPRFLAELNTTWFVVFVFSSKYSSAPGRVVHITKLKSENEF